MRSSESRFAGREDRAHLEEARVHLQENGDPAVVQRAMACVDRRKRFRKTSAASQALGVAQHEVTRPFGSRRACAQRSGASSTQPANRSELVGELFAIPLPEGEEVTRDFLIASLRAWCERQEPKAYPKSFSDVRWKSDARTITAQCARHDGCKARWVASASPGGRGSVHFKCHSEGHPHAGVLAVARSDARHGVSRVALRLGAEAAAVPNTVGKRKRPLEVQD